MQRKCKAVMRFKAVFFDLDGTLANSLEDLAASTNYVLKKHGFPVRETAEFRYFAGDGIAKMLARAMPQEAVNDASVDALKAEFLEYYACHFADRTVAYDGLGDLLARLKEQGVKLAVVTNKAQPMADLVVPKLFGDIFDLVSGMREGIPAKPDPTGLFLAMEALSVRPEESAFVGDTAMDIAVGVNAGAYPIGVLWGFRGKEELERAGARAFATDAAQLLQILSEEENAK